MAEANMSAHDIRKHYKNSFSSWFFFDYCLPIVFIVGFWPIADFLLKTPYAFERVFSSAELVPVASILMLGVSREIDTEKNLGRIGKDMNIFRQLGIFFPIVMLSAYCVLKFYSMGYDFPSKSGDSVDLVIERIPYVSIFSVIFAGAYCFAVKWGIISSLIVEINDD